MKNLMIFFSAITLNLSAQDTNRIVIDEVSQEAMLIGYCTREAFNDTNFSEWLEDGYRSYEVDSSTLGELNNELDQVNITIITGTWCSDSRIHLPAFFKILDYLGYPENKLTIIAVNEDKEVPGTDILDTYNLELVPSFIFYTNNSELGRIQELPEESLEKDMVRILRNNNN